MSSCCLQMLQQNVGGETRGRQLKKTKTKKNQPPAIPPCQRGEPDLLQTAESFGMLKKVFLMTRSLKVMHAANNCMQ